MSVSLSFGPCAARRVREAYIRLDILVLEVEGVLPDINTDDRYVSYSSVTCYMYADASPSANWTYKEEDPGWQ